MSVLSKESRTYYSLLNSPIEGLIDPFICSDSRDLFLRQLDKIKKIYSYVQDAFSSQGGQDLISFSFDANIEILESIKSKVLGEKCSKNDLEVLLSQIKVARGFNSYHQFFWWYQIIEKNENGEFIFSDSLRDARLKKFLETAGIDESRYEFAKERLQKQPEFLKLNPVLRVLYIVLFLAFMSSLATNLTGCAGVSPEVELTQTLDIPQKYELQRLAESKLITSQGHLDFLKEAGADSFQQGITEKIYWGIREKAESGTILSFEEAFWHAYGVAQQEIFLLYPNISDHDLQIESSLRAFTSLAIIFNNKWKDSGEIKQLFGEKLHRELDELASQSVLDQELQGEGTTWPYEDWYIWHLKYGKSGLFSDISLGIDPEKEDASYHMSNHAFLAFTIAVMSRNNQLSSNDIAPYISLISELMRTASFHEAQFINDKLEEEFGQDWRLMFPLVYQVLSGEIDDDDLNKATMISIILGVLHESASTLTRTGLDPDRDQVQSGWRDPNVLRDDIRRNLEGLTFALEIYQQINDNHSSSQ